MSLYIYQNTTQVGILDASADGFYFKYSPSYIADSNPPISISLPLQDKAFDQRSTTAFFDGLLPEENQRRTLADFLHVSSGSTIKLLKAIAGDCVGNITVLDEDMGIDELNQTSGYSAISEAEFTELLQPATMDRIPYLIASRISLGGAQAKFGAYFNGTDWFAPRGLAPSSHIIKPASSNYKSLLANEFFAMKLAEKCGILVPETNIIKSGPLYGLAIKRFDRVVVGNALLRQAQEDFCQALSIKPTEKYQEDGGPGLELLITTVQNHSTNPLDDLNNLIRIVMFNYLVGNCDAHAKNFSLTRNLQTRELSLSPAYDLVSTTYYPKISRSMAMKIGHHYVIDKINNEDFARLAGDAELDLSTMKAILSDLRSKISNNLDETTAFISDTHPDFLDEVKPFGEHLKHELEARKNVLA
ncbi:transcriptional regulator [Actinomycetota bacterium]|nr:transcriptional regulator [Actinomycetota bacterium]